MINRNDGCIEFDSPKISFSRGMTHQSFVKSSLFSLFTLDEDLDPCFTYVFGPATGSGRTFDGVVCFYSGVILKLSLRIIQPARPDGNEYFHRDYLRQILGDQPEGDFGEVVYRFTWGSIAAGEMKGVESDIWIRYVTN